MKRLKQIEETKQLIVKALIKLLNKNLLSDITISQIAKEAQIGRNTFYNHFKSKEEVLEYLFCNIVDEATKGIEDFESLNFKELLIWKFSLLKNYSVMKILTEQGEVRASLNAFRRNSFLMNELDKRITPYKKEFVIGGIDTVTNLWLENGMKETPEEMANLIMSFIARGEEIDES